MGKKEKSDWKIPFRSYIPDCTEKTQRQFLTRKRISTVEKEFRPNRNSLGVVHSLHERISVTELFSSKEMLPWYKQYNGFFKIFICKLELFYGSIPEENKIQKRPLEPVRVEIATDFELLRNNFREWLCVWKMTVPEGYPYKVDLLELPNRRWS